MAIFIFSSAFPILVPVLLIVGLFMIPIIVFGEKGRQDHHLEHTRFPVALVLYSRHANRAIRSVRLGNLHFCCDLQSNLRPDRHSGRRVPPSPCTSVTGKRPDSETRMSLGQ
jgi:hypothetical protein